MNIEVTTASRKEQKLSETAAAIYVITQEDIRRSGGTSIAEFPRPPHNDLDLGRFGL